MSDTHHQSGATLTSPEGSFLHSARLTAGMHARTLAQRGSSFLTSRVSLIQRFGLLWANEAHGGARLDAPLPARVNRSEIFHTSMKTALFPLCVGRFAE